MGRGRTGLSDLRSQGAVFIYLSQGPGSFSKVKHLDTQSPKEGRNTSIQFPGCILQAT